MRCGHRGGRGASHCCELWGQDSAGDRRSPPLSSPAAEAPASPPASCHAGVTVPSPRAQRRISRRTRRAASCCESRDGASRRSARLRRSRHRGQRAQLMPRARDARSQQRLPGWPPGPSAPSTVPHAAGSLHEPHTSICSVKILQVGVPRTSSCPRGRAAVRLASCDRGGGRRRGSEALGPGPLHSQPNGP